MLGPLLVLDVSFQFRTSNRGTRQPIKMCSLREIPLSLELQSKKYQVAGAIAHVHGNHFVPYCKSPDGPWDRRDDLAMNNVIKVLNDNECDEKNLVLTCLIYVLENEVD